MSDAIRHRALHVKLGLVRFVSHIDLINYYSRLLVRAGLAFAFTEGYNPKARFEFGPALSSGIESLAECFDFYLPEPADPEALKDRLNAKGVPGLAIGKILVAPKAKIARSLVGAEFRVTMRPAEDGDPAGVEAVLAAALDGALGRDGRVPEGLLEKVGLESREGDAVHLSFVTRFADGRFASPRALEALPGAEKVVFRHLKRSVAWKDDRG